MPHNFLPKRFCCLNGIDVDYTAVLPFDHLEDARYPDGPFGLQGTEITVEGLVFLTIAPEGYEMKTVPCIVFTTNTPYEEEELIIDIAGFKAPPDEVNEPEPIPSDVVDLTADTGSEEEDTEEEPETKEPEKNTRPKNQVQAGNSNHACALDSLRKAFNHLWDTFFKNGKTSKKESKPAEPSVDTLCPHPMPSPRPAKQRSRTRRKHHPSLGTALD